jgi:hypothetical protein
LQFYSNSGNFQVLPPTQANFVEFLEAHRQQVNALFRDTNTNLGGIREEFHRILSLESNRTAVYLNELLTELRNQEASTTQRLDQTTNSTCIQNLRNVLADTLSLSGFRIGTCAGQFYENSVGVSEPIYNQVTEYQLTANNLPIMFMAEMQGENVINDEAVVINRINARLTNERQMFEVQLPNFRKNMLPELERLLHNLNLTLSLCFIDILNNFRIVATLVEERISVICGQDES